MTKTTRLIAVVIALVAASVASCTLLWDRFGVPWAVSIHQRSVTESLREWRADHEVVASDADAQRTRDMIEYVEAYYVPGRGYRGFASVEAELEQARRETLDAWRAALREYESRQSGPP